MRMREALEDFGIDHFFDGTKFLQVDDDNAGVGLKCLLEGGLVVASTNRLHVDVHVEHLGVDLAAQLETVDDDHDLVVDVFSVAAQVFELQGSPTDDVGFAKSGGVLHERE